MSVISNDHSPLIKVASSALPSVVIFARPLVEFSSFFLPEVNVLSHFRAETRRWIVGGALLLIALALLKILQKTRKLVIKNNAATHDPSTTAPLSHSALSKTSSPLEMSANPKKSLVLQGSGDSVRISFKESLEAKLEAQKTKKTMRARAHGGVCNEEIVEGKNSTLNICYIASALQLLRVGYPELIERNGAESSAKALLPILRTMQQEGCTVTKEAILDLATTLFNESLSPAPPRQQGCAMELVQNLLQELQAPLFGVSKEKHYGDIFVDRSSPVDRMAALILPVQGEKHPAACLREALTLWSNDTFSELQEQVEGKAILKFATLPEILVITLQRFTTQPPVILTSEASSSSSSSRWDDDLTAEEWAAIAKDNRMLEGNATKLTHPVDMPDLWKVPAELLVDAEPEESLPEFQLLGFIYHEGATRASGHYYSYTRDNDVWYQNNDDKIQAVTTDELEAKYQTDKNQSVIYLYRRVPATSLAATEAIARRPAKA